MSLFIILLLTISQFLLGYALLNLFNIIIKPWLCIAASVLLAIAIYSLVPFFMELLHIRLTGLNIQLMQSGSVDQDKEIEAEQVFEDID